MVANEYGKALFELAQKNENIEVVEDNFNTLIEGIKVNPDYLKVLTYPRVSINDKKNSIKSVCKDFDTTFINFLYVLIDNNRIDQIFEIYSSFQNYILSNKNVLNVEVISAEELSDKQKKELIVQLTNYYNGKKIEISNIIDKSLIGGVKVIANGEALDLSLQNKLNQLKATI